MMDDVQKSMDGTTPTMLHGQNKLQFCYKSKKEVNGDHW
jgi:hypothetical protein